MNSLKQVLCEIAWNAPELAWRSDIRLCRPDAPEMAVDAAVTAMRMWREADNSFDLAHAGHCLDRAVRQLNVTVVAS